MQDLLNEEDFNHRRYNPWKRLKLFYIIAAIQALMLALTIFMKVDSGICVLQSVIYGASILFVPFVLVFGSENFILSKNWIIAAGLLLLNIVYSLLFFIPIITGSILSANIPDSKSIAFASVIIIAYIFTTPFVFIMRHFSLKRIKRENKAAVEKYIERRD